MSILKPIGHAEPGTPLNDKEVTEWLESLPPACCERCAYSERSELRWEMFGDDMMVADSGAMICRRFPLVFTGKDDDGSDIWSWPVTAGAEWCGEYEAQ